MDVTETKVRARLRWWSIAAALVVGVFDLSSLFLVHYQNYVVDIHIQHRAVVFSYPYSMPVMGYLEMLLQCLYPTPLLVVVIFRRYAGVTLAYVVMLFAIVVGRIYYLMQFYQVGISAVPKFDWPQLLFTIVGMVSVAVVAMWIMIRSVIFISKMLKSNQLA
jgi:hypothetical protein